MPKMMVKLTKAQDHWLTEIKDLVLLDKSQIIGRMIDLVRKQKIIK